MVYFTSGSVGLCLLALFAISSSLSIGDDIIAQDASSEESQVSANAETDGALELKELLLSHQQLLQNIHDQQQKQTKAQDQQQQQTKELIKQQSQRIEKQEELLRNVLDQQQQQAELLQLLLAARPQQSAPLSVQDVQQRSVAPTLVEHGSQWEVRRILDAHLLTPGDCSDLKKNNERASNGVYSITPWYREEPLEVYCDMHTQGGGWIVIQRRKDGAENFYRSWADYEKGFGALARDFWIGNAVLHELTSRGVSYRVRFDLTDHEGGRRYAEYDNFRVASACDKYRVSFSGYTGDAGDSFGPHNGQFFSTFNRDNDAQPTEHCAVLYKGGWWYKGCHSANPNGLYGSVAYGQGVTWNTWKGLYYSLKSVEIKIRPMNFCA